MAKDCGSCFSRLAQYRSVEDSNPWPRANSGAVFPLARHRRTRSAHFASVAVMLSACAARPRLGRRGPCSGYYFVAGCPDMECERWGSFEEWSRLIPHAIRFAGGPDVMAARIVDETSVNPELGHVAALINMWPNLIDAVNTHTLRRWKKRCEDIVKANREVKPPDQKPLPPQPTKRTALTCKAAIEALYDRGGASDSAFDPLREAIEGLCCPSRKSGELRPTTAALSGAMRKSLGRVVGGVCIHNHQDNHTKIAEWWVDKPAAGVAGVAGGVQLNPRKLSPVGVIPPPRN